VGIVSSVTPRRRRRHAPAQQAHFASAYESPAPSACREQGRLSACARSMPRSAQVASACARASARRSEKNIHAFRPRSLSATPPPTLRASRSRKRSQPLTSAVCSPLGCVAADASVAKIRIRMRVFCYAQAARLSLCEADTSATFVRPPMEKVLRFRPRGLCKTRCDSVREGDVRDLACRRDGM